MRKYDYITYEWRHDDSIVVHGWDEYPANSVLAGQARKSFIDSFETEEEVNEAFPDAEASHPMMQPQNTFNHLPDTPDW